MIELVELGQRMTTEWFVRNMLQDFMPYAGCIKFRRFHLMHDDDHTFNIVEQYVDVFKKINWPPRSLDLDLIEHVGDMLQRQIRRCNPPLRS